MAELEIPISGLPPATLPLSGSEKVPMVQGGVTVEASTQDIANLGDGGSSTFEDLTDSPYDNTLLAEALNSKQDRINGIVSGCEITVETFAGVGTNKRIRVTNGTWYISPSEYTKATDTVSAEITLCVTGGDFKYYDIVADNTGAITIHEGTPSTSPSHYVINPLTEVLLGFIVVGDAVIEEPTPIVTSLTKKTQYFGVLSGSQTLNCENKDFAIFYFDTNGTSLTLSFNNYYNLVNGVLFIRILFDTTIDLPFVSYEYGQSIASKVLKVGNYAVFFETSGGNFYFQFNKDVFGEGVVSSSITSENDKYYNVISSATFTDPTGINGKGYTVFVQNGTATIGGVGYVAGKVIKRIYNSGWTSTEIGGSGGCGAEITDSGTIATITNPSNYNDSYGNNSPPIGGIFNTTIPSGISEHDYYIEPAGTDGLPRHKIECKKITSTLSLIRIPYIY